MQEDQNLLMDRLYREMYQQLLIYARNALQDISLAEEAVQDTFRIACVKIEDVENSSNQKGWLMETLKNVIKNIRRQQIQIAKIANAVIVNEIADTAELEVSIDALYSGIIPEKDFLLLKRLVQEQLTMTELSEELGVPLETCKKRVQRARNKMKKEFQSLF